MQVRTMEFDEFKIIVEQNYQNGIALYTKTKAKILVDIENLHQSCPCGPNNTCANIGQAIPIINSRHGIANIENSIEKRKSHSS